MIIARMVLSISATLAASRAVSGSLCVIGVFIALQGSASFPTVRRVVILVVELDRALLDPIDELDDLLMLKQPLHCVVVVVQFTLRECGVNLLVASPMNRDCFPSLEGLRD